MFGRAHLFAGALMGAALVQPVTVLAADRTFRIDSNASSDIDVSVCSNSVYLVANGDDDTDLDFWLYDNNGTLVHTDTDTTDITFYTIENQGAGGGRCLPYRLRVSNLGDVYNNMVLSLTDQGTTSSADVQKSGGGGTTGVSNTSFRIDASSTKDLTMTLCAPQVYVEARGDGDTDLDFWVYDENGKQVHTDTDSTDITFVTLNSGRARGSCIDYTMRVQNFGDVYNQLALTLTEQ
jgi:hypothetical protein